MYVWKLITHASGHSSVYIQVTDIETIRHYYLLDIYSSRHYDIMELKVVRSTPDLAIRQRVCTFQPLFLLVKVSKCHCLHPHKCQSVSRAHGHQGRMVSRPPPRAVEPIFGDQTTKALVDVTWSAFPRCGCHRTSCSLFLGAIGDVCTSW